VSKAELTKARKLEKKVDGEGFRERRKVGKLAKKEAKGMGGQQASGVAAKENAVEGGGVLV
jgi:hypothetical protein